MRVADVQTRHTGRVYSDLHKKPNLRDIPYRTSTQCSIRIAFQIQTAEISVSEESGVRGAGESAGSVLSPR